MPGGMTRRMKAHVSTMLTEKRFEYCTPVTPTQAVRADDAGTQADNLVGEALVGLTTVDWSSKSGLWQRCLYEHECLALAIADAEPALSTQSGGSAFLFDCKDSHL